MTARRPLVLLLALLPLTAAAAAADHRGRWTPVQRHETCIGGQRCGPYALEIPLSGAPVEAVRFYAHDAVGDKTGGRLRISVDGQVVAWDLDVKRAGAVHEIDVGGIRGHRLVFEALSHDEVVVQDVEVLYAGGRHRRGY